MTQQQRSPPRSLSPNDSGAHGMDHSPPTFAAVNSRSPPSNHGGHRGTSMDSDETPVQLNGLKAADGLDRYQETNGVSRGANSKRKRSEGKGHNTSTSQDTYRPRKSPTKEHHHDPYPELQNGVANSNSSPEMNHNDHQYEGPNSYSEMQMGEALRHSLAMDNATSTPNQNRGHASAPNSAPVPIPPATNSLPGSMTKQRKRNFTNRTKTGCLTCRERKKKCDERKPICNNCTRGGFACKGYTNTGAMLKNTTLRDHQPLQAKNGAQVYDLPPSYPPNYPPAPNAQILYPPPDRDSRSRTTNSDEDRNQPPQDSRPPHAQVPYPRIAQWHTYPSAQYPPPPPPHPDTPRGKEIAQVPPPSSDRSLPPLNSAQPSSHHRSTNSTTSTTIPSHYTNHADVAKLALQEAPPSTSTPTPTPSTTTTSHSHTHSHSHSRPLHHTHSHSAPPSEKEKMLAGLPFDSDDPELTVHRQECLKRISFFNRHALQDHTAPSDPEHISNFIKIIEPQIDASNASPFVKTIPSGQVKDRVRVQAPFYADYGYNIEIGNDTRIGPRCHIMDARQVKIGSRCIIGPDVSFYAQDGDHYLHEGQRRDLTRRMDVAKPIFIGDDVFIGGKAVILPGITIADGATIGAAAVISKDVKPGYTAVKDDGVRFPTGYWGGHGA